MTNSAKSNKPGASSGTTEDNAGPARAVDSGLLESALEAVAVLVGWGLILRVGHWHFSASVFFLFVGWLGVVLCARFLWDAALAATSPDDADFARAEGRRQDLLLEKRALLKAIKEIEFDHQMGKMSDRDASEISTLYRNRAIEVIKALEGKDGGGAPGKVVDSDDDIRAAIDREVDARLAASEKSAPTGGEA
jgi:hypothetical protein